MSLKSLYYKVFCGVRKNLHLPYYFNGIRMSITPRWFTEYRREALLRSFDCLPALSKDYVQERVNYYNRLTTVSPLPLECPMLGEQHYFRRNYPSVYYFDSYEWTRYYPREFRWSFAPGDITAIFDVPTIAKSRPIEASKKNPNSIVINMDKVRHFMFFRDPIPFEKKENRAVFRGAIHGKPVRMQLIEKYFDHPQLDILDTSTNSIYPFYMRQQGEMSVYDHLKFKYILSLEGNDVASNLKWVMNSNSLAVSPCLHYETWFMEGRLVPGEHFIEIKPDCSDLIEKLTYYDEHPAEARAIVENAHEYCRQFFNKEYERLISLMVMEKYFRMTDQLR